MDSILVFNIIWKVLVVLLAVATLITIGVILSENRNPVKALAWVTVLAVIPVVGMVLYIVFGRNIRARRLMKRSHHRKLRQRNEGCPFRPSRGSLSHRSMQLIRLATSMGCPPAQIYNSLSVYSDGRAKFNKLLDDISNARSYIYIQYYIISNDFIGRRLCDLLIRKAREGVNVYLIYDPVGSFPNRKKFFRNLIANGVKTKPFIPVRFPSMGVKINWRNHRKLCVIDGETGYIGGMNVADRYIDGGSTFDMWRDLHLRVCGPVVASFETSFIADWNFLDDNINVLLQNKPPMLSPPKPGNMVTQLVTSGPTSHWFAIESMFLKAIASAMKRVYIITPYFLPTEGLLAALKTAALAKIDVRIMIPKRSDSRMLNYASASYIAECLRAGIKIYLFKSGMLHSKALIVDEEISSVGSTNFDFRSFEHNFESNLFIYNRDFNSQMVDLFYRDMALCEKVEVSQWKYRSRRQKIFESITRLLAPIL